MITPLRLWALRGADALVWVGARRGTRGGGRHRRHGIHSRHGRSAPDGPGRARLELGATDEHLNKAGTVHGGVLATLVDMAMGQALRSRTGDNDVPATSQLTVTYLRPGKPGTLVVSAQVRKQGENLSVCEA